MTSFLLPLLVVLVAGSIAAGNAARGTIRNQRAKIAQLESDLAQAKSDLAAAKTALAQAKRLARKIQSI